ncbi:hypothetical protein [Bradyrhizobium sp. sGM-13]|uniref:hypothetical protein n=1 Tax=Bradyrhizobium sp. sGM-13 TaxID=2831781 RepID=UPI001BD15A6B|nr:hypothetical protein [Bradyrhizobium sp. sGM-13]
MEKAILLSNIDWLTSQGSNLHIPECKKPFEMSDEFPAFCRNFGLETFAPTG